MERPDHFCKTARPQHLQSFINRCNLCVTLFNLFATNAICVYLFVQYICNRWATGPPCLQFCAIYVQPVFNFVQPVQHVCNFVQSMCSLAHACTTSGTTIFEMINPLMCIELESIIRRLLFVQSLSKPLITPG